MRCHVEDVCRRMLIFSRKVLKDRGKADTMSASAKPCVHGFWRTWMARVGAPVIMRTTYHFSLENSHPETRHQGVMFRSPWAFVEFTTALRYEPCIQFINVSQKTLHIYFIDGCRVCPLDARYKNRTKQPLV